MATQLMDTERIQVERLEPAVVSAEGFRPDQFIVLSMAIGALIGAVLCYATIRSVAEATTMVFFVTTAAVSAAAVGASAGLLFAGLAHVIAGGSLEDK